ncbi:MAG TPA: hypothetical protein DEH78_31420, partial [Solibacterales bacterium]|nr:hypothetical protein [Bryobacterales bacterium]
GGWVFYNTKVLNTLNGPKDLERRQADYEKLYKNYQKLTAPRIVSASYRIDLFPATREANLHGTLNLVNKSSNPIPEVHFTLNPGFEHQIRLPGSRLHLDDQRLSYRIYKLDPPLQPGEQRRLDFTTRAVKKGFAN